jgi:hypothetical protein
MLAVGEVKKKAAQMSGDDEPIWETGALAPLVDCCICVSIFISSRGSRARKYPSAFSRRGIAF